MMDHMGPEDFALKNAHGPLVDQTDHLNHVKRLQRQFQKNMSIYA